MKFPTDDEIRQWLEKVAADDEEGDGDMIREFAAFDFGDWETWVHRADEALVTGVGVGLWALADSSQAMDGFMVTARLLPHPVQLSSGHLDARSLADFDLGGVDALVWLISNVFAEAQRLVSELEAFVGERQPARTGAGQ